MKYWILTSEYKTENNDEITTYIKQHAQIFADRGHNVLLIHGQSETDDVVTSISPNITLHSFSVKGKSSTSYLGYHAALSFEFANQVISLLSNDTPDVIEIQEYLGIGYYLLLRKYCGEPLLKKIPIIVTAHMPLFVTMEYDRMATYRFPQYWTGEMEKFCLLSADLLLCASNYLLRRLNERMPEAFAKNYHNIHYPPHRINTAAGVPIEKGTLLVWDNLSVSKGALQLVQAANRLWKNGNDFRIQWIVNADVFIETEEQTTLAYLQNKYPEHIASGKLKLIVHTTQHEISSLITAAHAVVIPSLIDNLPYAAIRAMAAGKAVLASASGGQAELIQDGITGFIFDWDIAGSFENKLEQVLSLHTDQLEQIGKNAINSISMCSDEQYYTGKYKLITDLIGSYTPKNNFPVIRPQEKKEGASRQLQNGMLTVVIPYYNMGEFVEDCVASIYAGSFKQIKILIIDDGSTDENSILKLTHIQRKFPEVQIRAQKNGGLSAARNAGLQIADTQYITFLDPDDTIDDSYFKKTTDILDQYENISFAGCWLKYFGADEGIWPGQNPEVPYLLFHNTVHSGCVFKTKDILQTGGYDSSLIYGMEDYEMTVNMVSKGFHGVCIPEPLYNYRIRKQSMARAFTDNKKLYLYRLLSAKHKDLFDKYGYECVNMLNANGPGYGHDNPTFAVRPSIQHITPKNYVRLLVNDFLNNHPKLRKLYQRTFKRNDKK